MKIFICLILAILFNSVQADVRLAVSPYLANESDSYGAVIELSGSGDFLWKADINISQNFAGPSVAIGMPFDKVNVYLGYQDIIRHDKQSGFVDVGGVPVFDPDSDAQGNGIYLEAQYKKFFVRYTEYDIDYTLRGTRIIIVNGKPIGLSNREVFNLSGSVVWAGFVFPFK